MEFATERLSPPTITGKETNKKLSTRHETFRQFCSCFVFVFAEVVVIAFVVVVINDIVVIPIVVAV